MSSPQIERKLAAIMFTDIVGFTKIMGDDESAALSILENQKSLINPIVNQHKGNIIKNTGDGFLIDFPSTVEAVECATKMQDSIKSYNTSDDNIEFHIRIGIHLGDIVILGDDILGDGVNIASRIEPLASPDGICITDAVYQSVKSKLKLDAKRIDDVDLKHIDDKYTIYKLFEKNNDIGNIEKKYEDVIIPNLNINKIVNKYDSSINFVRLIILTLSLSTLTVLCFKSMKLFVSILTQTIKPVISYYTSDESPENMPDFTSIFTNIQMPDFTQIFPDGIEKILLIILVSSSFIVFCLINRNTIITFKDIRDVNNIVNILLIQMDYEYLGKEEGKMKFYYDGLEEDWTKLNSFIKNNYLLKKLNILSLNSDGNTITINAQNWQVKSLIKEIKKFTTKSKS